MNKVWVVTYRDRCEEPVVTLFDNEDAAKDCYKEFKKEHWGAWIDEAPIYSNFSVKC